MIGVGLEESAYFRRVLSEAIIIQAGLGVIPSAGEQVRIVGIADAIGLTIDIVRICLDYPTILI